MWFETLAATVHGGTSVEVGAWAYGSDGTSWAYVALTNLAPIRPPTALLSKVYVSEQVPPAFRVIGATPGLRHTGTLGLFRSQFRTIMRFLTGGVERSSCQRKAWLNRLRPLIFSGQRDRPPG